MTFPMGSLHSQIEKLRRGRGNQRSRTHSRELRQGRLWCHACMQTACRACASGKCLRRATSCESSEGHSVPRDGSETTGSVVPLLSRRSRVSCQRRGSREGGPQAPAVRSERARARAATQAHRCPLWLYRPVGRGDVRRKANRDESHRQLRTGMRRRMRVYLASAPTGSGTTPGHGTDAPPSPADGASASHPRPGPSNSRPRKSPAHRRADMTNRERRNAPPFYMTPNWDLRSMDRSLGSAQL